MKIPALKAVTGAPAQVERLLELGYLVRSGEEVLSVVKEYGWEVRSAGDRNEQPCGSLRPIPVDTEGVHTEYSLASP